ncbi:MAG TPA: GPP34 family phosphoprotein [Longilinea sp.]|nr:GPP34 family phosphoprotein [Longilinea sp.]
MLSLAEELFLLSLREKKKNIGFSSTFALTYSLAGALMAELALSKKVAINSEKKVVALDISIVDDPNAQEMLEAIQNSSKPKRLSHWIDVFGSHSKKLQNSLMDALVAKGVVKEEKKRYLWAIPYKEYSQLNASAKFGCKERLRRVVLGGEEADERAVALLSLLYAAGLLEHIFTEDEIKASIKQVKEIVKNEAIGQTVIELLNDITDAATAAAIAAASVSS